MTSHVLPAFEATNDLYAFIDSLLSKYELETEKPCFYVLTSFSLDSQSPL